jgi:hypothetical protein
LKQEIARCRRDPLFHDSHGLRVTWASIDDPRDVDAVAAYLYRQLRPLWGESLPWTQPVAINVPWTA